MLDCQYLLEAMGENRFIAADSRVALITMMPNEKKESLIASVQQLMCTTT
ncbi:hypothetical protein [Magnetospirillum sp. SS-4]|nr:hypothetical protein [Magnetospirillum sp. SS-4]CAA7618378.1 hypothetical protein MTBSS4_210084 [Magnetospirillum sp. SS-4]